MIDSYAKEAIHADNKYMYSVSTVAGKKQGDELASELLVSLYNGCDIIHFISVEVEKTMSMIM